VAPVLGPADQSLGYLWTHHTGGAPGAELLADLEALARQAALAAERMGTRDSSQERAADPAGARRADAQPAEALGGWEWDLSSGKVHLSDELYRIHGVERGGDKPSLDWFLGLVHPDDRGHVETAIREAVEERGRYELLYRVVGSGGDVRLLHAHGEIIGDGAERPARVVGAVRDITERRDLEERLQRLAFGDQLTGLPNRALLMSRLRRALKRSERDGSGVAVLYLDLDRFKAVNESLGHETGDRVLAAVARRIERCLRSGDTAARLAADEFAVLLERVGGLEDAVGVADRIIEALRPPLEIDGRHVFATASVGVALATQARENPEELLRYGDLAMGHAKRRGKARLEVFEPAMLRVASARLELEHDLRRALRRHEFLAYYQPFALLESTEIIGVEALLRWEHPEKGLILPDEFIGLAEETGLILPIGRWMLERACAQARRWHKRFPAAPPLMMSVNLSARQFEHPALVQEVAQALEHSGIEPSSLQLELTESAVMQDVEAAVVTMRRLKELGVRLAIDDFGAGHSSLRYLQRFLVDTLKIDRSFIARVDERPADAAIVSAVLALGRALGMRVTAEGVETQAQLERLRSLGCEVGQGYYFWKPRPPEDAAAIISRKHPTPVGAV
jgi:diguanylate cyclase (GGDEF)-like protein/PAS domain S-box-containing protein